MSRFIFKMMRLEIIDIMLFRIICRITVEKNDGNTINL
jgi:hypothetical protein